VTKADKRRYLVAIGSGRPFEQEYKTFNGCINVRFRALKAGEYDMLTVWAVKKAQEETRYQKVDFDAFLVVCQRHEYIAKLALQTTYITSNIQGSDLFWAVPEGYKTVGLKEWGEPPFNIKTLDDLIERFRDTINVEAIISALLNRLSEFNRLDYQLTIAANDTENFWKGI
jgi:hypothetical protein